MRDSLSCLLWRCQYEAFGPYLKYVKEFLINANTRQYIEQQ